MQALGTFAEEGKAYVVHTPHTPTAWNNILFNDTYYMEVSQRMQGKSFFLEGYHANTYTTGARYFYLRRADGTASRLFAGEGEAYSCTYRLGTSTAKERIGQVEAAAQVLVPVQGEYEIWQFTLTNKGESSAEVSLFSAVPFSNSGPMGGECRYIEAEGYLYKYSFPYHVFYEDKEKVEHKKAYYYMMSDRAPASYDGSGQRFWGSDGAAVPEAVLRGKCSNTDSEGEDFMGCMQHSFHLAPQQSETVVLIIGVAAEQEEIRARRQTFPNVAEELEKVEKLWQKRCACFHIETPEKELNYLANYWLKKQMVYLTRLNRVSAYCPVRNQLQDALGYAMIDPEEALTYALRVLRRQRADGSMKQWYMTDGSPERALCHVDHSDAPLWLVLCLTEIIEKTGNADYYQKLEGYIDDSKQESILTHLVKAARYMAGQLGAHGLCLMKDGDWTDPINGAGRGGKGESTWNTLALIDCLRRLDVLAPEEGFAALAEQFTESVNQHCWDGKWYVAGFDDNGRPFGTERDTEAKLFLNAQTWAIICGAVPPERMETLQNSIALLQTKMGYRLLAPAFKEWNSIWGRISIKQAGTTENGSVYCHASMFAALAQAVTGDGAGAVQTILQTLPTNPENPPENNMQLPLFVPNYYFGLDTPNFGRSSCHMGTGTVAWLLWVLVEHIFGVQATCGGLTVHPKLPKAWAKVTLTRIFRGEEYEIKYREGTAVCEKRGTGREEEV